MMVFARLCSLIVCVYAFFTPVPALFFISCTLAVFLTGYLECGMLASYIFFALYAPAGDAMYLGLLCASAVLAFVSRRLFAFT
jgi:hypothetical protein